MSAGSLDDGDLDADPIAQFGIWYRQAVDSGEPEPHAMALATGAGAAPSVRYVLMKDFGPRGFVFYTNRNSRKGREIAADPRVALAFRWRLMERQVRAVGTASPVPDSESDDYFASRPRAAQLGAWASDQSEPVQSRSVLDAKLSEVAARFEGRSIPRPPWWGGYVVHPSEMEFWVSHADRLHDRFQYVRSEHGWTLRRLYP